MPGNLSKAGIGHLFHTAPFLVGTDGLPRSPSQQLSTSQELEEALERQIQLLAQMPLLFCSNR